MATPPPLPLQAVAVVTGHHGVTEFVISVFDGPGHVFRSLFVRVQIVFHPWLILLPEFVSAVSRFVSPLQGSAGHGASLPRAALCGCAASLSLG